MKEILVAMTAQIPTLVWGALAFYVFFHIRKPFIRDVLPRLGQLKAGGLELSFAEQSIAKAVESANDNNIVVASTMPKGKVEISKSDRERVLQRALKAESIISGKRVLWIDDVVDNNRLERDMLEAVGLKIEQVQSNKRAEQALAKNQGGYDIILSDIAREAGAPSGLDFLESYRKKPDHLPVIFYISELDEDLPLPPGAFGLSNRPDEILHLVIDALARRA